MRSWSWGGELTSSHERCPARGEGLYPEGRGIPLHLYLMQFFSSNVVFMQWKNRDWLSGCHSCTRKEIYIAVPQALISDLRVFAWHSRPTPSVIHHVELLLFRASDDQHGTLQDHLASHYLWSLFFPQWPHVGFVATQLLWNRKTSL